MTRREVLKGTLAVAGGLAAACKQPSPDVRPDAAIVDGAPSVTSPEEIPASALFPEGVASGDAQADAIVVQARYTGDRTLALWVWEMDGDRYARGLGPFPATPADGGFVHVEVTGLAPGRKHRYAFCEMNQAEPVARSPIGRFRQPPDAGSRAPMRLAAASCFDHEDPFDCVDQASRRDDIDVFLYLGDNAYCDGSDTVDQYRERWATHLVHPEYQALRASTSMFSTWDDHEVQNDWNPETIQPGKLAAAIQANFEHMPIRRSNVAPDRLYRSVRWGLTAELFALDLRSERRPSTMLSDNPINISSEQLAWLKNGLLASPCTFKIILSSTPITDMPVVWVDPRERWEGYDAQRRHLLQFIDDNVISGVLWVGGDFHLSFISHVAMSGPGSRHFEVVVSPIAQKTNDILVPTLQAPQFPFAFAARTYVTLALDPQSSTVVVTYVGADGGVIASESLAIV